MVLIKQATFGDETSATDITDTLQGKITNGYLDVVADSKLLPMVTLTATKAELTDSDKGEARKNAIEQCGGNANDQQCIDERTAKIEQSMLQTKLAEQNATDKTVKGRRLTVTVVGDDGTEQTLQIPDGQEFKLGNPPLSSKLSGITIASTLAFLWTPLLLFVWVFSVVMTYKVFVQEGYQFAGYFATAVSVFLPYSGYLLILGLYLVKAYMNQKSVSV